MRSALLTAFALLFVLTGCATGAPAGGAFSKLRYTFATPSAAPRAVPGGGSGTSPTVLTRDPEARERVIASARSLLGKKRMTVNGERFADACNGLIDAAFHGAGLELAPDYQPGDNSVTALFRFARIHGRVFERGTPRAGDLVFFRETYDQNRDGRRNDGLTHVGLVEDVLEDGTVLVIHHVRRGVVRYRMNLEHAGLRKDPKSGKIVNDYLRPAGRTAGQVLTGQLFVAYGSLLPETSAAVAGR